MLEWLKTILGDAYNEETDKKVSEQIGKDFVARADFNAANEAKKTAEASVKERDKQIEELKKVDPAELQKTIDTLQTENKAAQEKHEAELKALHKDRLLDAKLIQEGAVNVKAVKALLDLEKISVDGDNLVGIDEPLKALKTAEKWAFGTQQTGRTGSRQQGDPPPGGDTNTLAGEITSALYGGGN